MTNLNGDTESRTCTPATLKYPTCQTAIGTHPKQPTVDLCYKNVNRFVFKGGTSCKHIQFLEDFCLKYGQDIYTFNMPPFPFGDIVDSIYIIVTNFSKISFLF